MMRFISTATLFLLALSASAVDAQSRRPVRRGEVTGVELSLEGRTSAARGETLRWTASAYEVVGLDQLRPARGARLDVATALDADAQESIEMGRDGTAVVEIPIPMDAPNSFGVTLTLRAPRGVTRRFELRVNITDSRALLIYAAPSVVAGGNLVVYGAYTGALSAPLSHQDIDLVLNDGRGPLGGATTVQTDANGVFHAELRVPRDSEGQLRVVATGPALEHRRATGQTSSRISSPETPAMLIHATPRQAIVAPGAPTLFDVIVRRGDGRPVKDAVVTFQNFPLIDRIAAIPDENEDRYAITDARGRTTLTLDPRITRRFADTPRDHAVRLHAGAAGVGTASTSVSVRVSRHTHAATLRIEGSAFAPGLMAQVYALVTGVDGLPAAGRDVLIEGPGIGTLRGQSNASGVVSFDVRFRSTRDDSRCGGTSATSVRLSTPGGPTTELCLPVDVDQSTRPRIREAGAETVSVEIQRRTDTARAPVLVTVHQAGTDVPLALAIAPAGTDSVDIALPASRGDLVVRTRALMGANARPVRGAHVRLIPSDLNRPVSGVVEGGENELSLSVTHQSAQTTVAFAIPHEEAGAIGQAQVGDIEFRRAMAVGQVRRDVGAPYVLRDGRVIATPVPSGPAATTILRDPWRASERFVEGRLALVFRALEAAVDAAVPGQVSNVATQTGGRLSLNAELLASLSESSLGGEGATGLGGEALTITQLKRLDRNFNYDAVARRITRRRLFGLLLGLRNFVRQRGFDLPWATPGDPTLWLAPLNGQNVPGFGQITARSLADGWGRPFALRRVTNARFQRVQPVAGFELVSAGPDGRFGTGDDIRDPTARVLREGSLYANAVGEGDLVARLGGVELGRASATAIARAFGQNLGGVPAPRETSAQASTMPGLPGRLPEQRFAMALRRPGTRFTVPSVVLRGAGNQSASLRVGSEPRTWRVVRMTRNAHGDVHLDSDTVQAGSSILTSARLPARLRVGEAFAVPFSITNVGSQSAQYTLDSAESSLRVDAPASLEVPAGESRSFEMVLEAATAGRATLSMSVGSGGASRVVERRISVDRGLHPLRRVATGVAPFRTRLSVPSEASTASTRVVLVNSSSLALDPDLAEARRSHPALLAWSRTLAGAPVEGDLRAALLRDGGVDPLSVATGVVALSAVFDEEGRPDTVAAAKRQQLLARLRNAPAFTDRDPQAARLRTIAMSLAALATAGVPSEVVTPTDPISVVLLQWRRELRTALRDVPGESSLLARAAASLLLVDPQDGHGRAMYERAVRGIQENNSFSTVPGSADRPGSVEELSATLSLSIAAHQVGDSARARSLLRGAARQMSTLTRDTSEATFWWLAAGAYGVMGSGASMVNVEIDGADVNVDLSAGVAAVPVDAGAGDSVRVRMLEDDHLVLARVETVYGRAFEEQEGTLLGIVMNGETGRVDGRTGFELELTARAAVSRPILEVQLPAGVLADDAALRLLASSGAVLRATRRRPGFVRLELAPMAAETSQTIPLPLTWRSTSTVRGLGAIAYPAGQPYNMTVLAPRALTPTE